MNYIDFFGFSDSPFQDVPDQKFLFLPQKHELLLTELAEFVSTRRGIAVVSGDDGVGKTMLVQTLLQRLPESFRPLVLTRPAPEPLAITLMIAQALDLNLGGRTLVNINPLAEALQAAAQQNKYFFLIMEDAHLLTDQNLEEIYLLSQMEHQGQQLMPILLVGRKGLVQKIASKANQRLHDLISKNLFLNSLTFEETTLYIDHRLQQVGSSFKERFAEGCSGQIFSRTGGIPRRLNQVCDQALNRAWQENRARVTRDLLVVEEPKTPYKPLEPPSKWRSLNSFAAVVAGVLLAGLAGYIVYNNYAGLAPPRTSTPPAPTPAVAAKAPLVPLRQEPTPGPATVPQPHTPVQTAAKLPAQQNSLPAPPQAPQTAVAQPLPVASTPPAPPSPEPASEPESSRPATYQVAPEDGLIKIVGTYYPDEKEIGYDAVILANPRITNEDIIYPGQTLSLPKVDKSNNIITVGGKDHFGMFGQYYNSTQVEKTVSKLKELQIPYVVRETEIPDEGKIYRIFVGAYESLDELKKAMAQAEKN
jgi:type II secretory pathway predicted ATPase ExeA